MAIVRWGQQVVILFGNAAARPRGQPGEGTLLGNTGQRLYRATETRTGNSVERRQYREMAAVSSSNARRGICR